MGNRFREARLKYVPPLPSILKDLDQLELVEHALSNHVQELESYFPKTIDIPLIQAHRGKERYRSQALRVGVLFSGGQASGGHNVISGLFDALKKLHSSSRLFGFLNGPEGVLANQYKELKAEELQFYRNTGGFDLIGSGRKKIQSQEELSASLKHVTELNLDGLVVIGGDDSNTNAAVLAEYFLQQGVKTKVLGVPKTIDGDLKNEYVEISFGFDTACKTYAELIGNIERDALSAKKYYHFIKLMGRSASHIALECALQTHPNFTLIGEEVEAKRMSFDSIEKQLAKLIIDRAKAGKHYGVILIPEGLIEFIPEMQQLIQELNALPATTSGDELSAESRRVLALLPERVQNQLLHDRDPHGNVPVSQIPTEELIMYGVEQELKRQGFQGPFNPIRHFFGYEGRAGYPSNFDANYCYTLGHVAAALIDRGLTGYLCFVQHLAEGIEDWEIGGVPITHLMHLEMRQGEQIPVIAKALVDLEGTPFMTFEAEKESWMQDDDYRFPSSIQYFGDRMVTDETTFTLQLAQQRAELL